MKPKFIIKNLFRQFLPINQIPSIQKTHYTQLTLNTTYYLKNKTPMILYYTAELNFVFQHDFKNNLFLRTLNLLSQVLASRNLIKKIENKNVTKQELIFNQRSFGPIFYRREFATIFGVLPIKIKPMRIKKIQFKPGYLKFFRRLRVDYKKTNNLYFVYQ